MNYINEKVVLEFYLKELEADKINFLRGHHKQRVKERVEKLLEGESIHSKIEAAKNLWKALFEAAMSYIDPDKRGYDKIFKYFDEFVNFEELIFASDSFYRDHTLHSLWVYFLGEYINLNDEFEYIIQDTKILDNVLREGLQELKSANREGILDSIIESFQLHRKIIDVGAAARCVIALCHDLGYPLKKIEKINKSICSVLPYFSVSNINEFKFKYNEVDQLYIDKFINILSRDMFAFFEPNDIVTKNIIERIFKTEDAFDGVRVDEINKLTSEEIDHIKKMFNLMFKSNLNYDQYLCYSRNFEEYKHGIMSAFLLTKNLKAFESMNVVDSNTDTPISGVKNFVSLKIKQIILKAITNHTNDNYLINGLLSMEEMLTFVDELEEFSRISRANKNREYVEEFCHSRLYVEDEWLNIEFIFDNENLGNLDPERAFRGRCERFLKLFNIPRLSNNLKIRLKCIGKLKFDDNEYVLEIARKYARITINGEEKFIPRYLKSTEYYSREEYQEM